MNYSFYEAQNISISVKEGVVTIAPDKEFIGIRYIFFIANNSEYSRTTNIIEVKVVENIITKNLTQLPAEIGKPVKWVRKSKNKTIEIPELSYNLSISKIINDKRIRIDENRI